MKRTLRILGTLAAIWVSLFSISCKYDLISEPTIIDNNKKNPSDYADEILPPVSINASHGTYRVIDLEWSKVENAVQYQIFAATTPFDTFEQIGETVGADTKISIEYPSGINMYFAIAAVNYYGTVSSKSNVVLGSTLAVPIITSITPSDDAQSVKICWWMDNCDESTYANQTKFEITAYDSRKKLIPESLCYADKTTREIELHGLSPKTDYFFQIEAILYELDGNRVNQKSEKSDLTSAATTHSIVPKTVNNFSVSQGESTEHVILSWNIPEGADFFDSASNTYKIHPVAFHVQRKPINTDDTFYETIDKIGVTNSQNPDYSHYSAPTIKYDCSSINTYPTSHSELTVTPSTEHALEEYPQYVPDSLFVYKDKSATRGKQYTYRIITYTDDTQKQITAKSSISEVKNGWKIANATFKANADYVKSETEFTNITTTFAFSFTDFGLKTNYNYILTSTITPFDNQPPKDETICLVTDNITNILSTVYHNDLSDNNTYGYYKYKLYITPISISTIPISPSDCYLTLESAGTITITNDIRKLPTIENFSIEDGYSDKFIISWDNYLDTCSYRLSWITYENNEPIEDPNAFVDIQKSDLQFIEGNKVKYNHTSTVSGDIRSYSLTADCGMKITEVYTETVDSQKIPKKCKTLGTATPTITDIDFNKITLSWPAVQMADHSKYTIEAEYYNDESVSYDDEAAALKDLITPANILITPSEDNSIYTCTIENIKGYNDPTISGLPIKLKIIAKNDKDTVGTKAETTARTLGPALLHTKTSTNPYKNYLEISWKDIEGASKYLVYRVQYKDKTESQIENTDLLFIEGTTVTNGQQQEIAGRTVVSYENGKYTLRDYQKDAVDMFGYHLTQDKIQWGLPYGYIVLPLKSNSTKNTFKFIENTLILDNSSAVNYGELIDTKTSTPGYGLNVTASKATSSSGVVIKWDAPNNRELIPTVYRKRFNQDSNFDYGNSWEYVHTLPKNAVTYTDILNKDENAFAFIYAVQYSASKQSDFVPSFRKNLNDTKDIGISPEEPKNKGYLLTLEDFSATYGGDGVSPTSYYQENITWKTLWDYKERALGPDSFTIDIKNKNLSSTKNWTTIASYSYTDSQLSDATIEQLNDTTIKQISDGLTIEPTNLSTGNGNSTTGVLTVLRDAKHYYSVNLKRGQTSGRQAEDESIYAYRPISYEEFIKSAIIYINEGFRFIDKLDFESKSDSGTLGGTITASHQSTMNMGKEYIISFTNYKTEVESPQNTPVSLYSITAKFTVYRDQLGIGGYIKSINPTEITVKPIDDSLHSSYSGKFSISCKSYKEATISYASINKTITTANDRHSWLPFKMHNDENWYHESIDYGWWN